MHKGRIQKLDEYSLTWPVYSSYTHVSRDRGLGLITRHLKRIANKRDIDWQDLKEDLGNWVYAKQNLISEGFIVADTKDKPRYYNPFESLDIVNEFAAIGKDKRISELAFIHKFGLLGYFGQKDIFGWLGFEYEPNVLSPLYKIIEPLAWFKAEQRDFSYLLEIYHTLKAPEPFQLIKLLESSLWRQSRLWDKWKALWEADNTKDYRYGKITYDEFCERVKEKQERWVEDIGFEYLLILFIDELSERLKVANPFIKPTSLKPIEFSWEYTCPTLLDAIYVRLGLEITGRADLKRCEGCSVLFFDRKGKGQPRKYHSKRCGDAARQRKAYKERKTKRQVMPKE
jgi:hypothetical protein